MLPWETPTLIRHNLGVIASLRIGEKLSVLKDGENIGHGSLGNHRGLREQFKVSSSAFARGAKGETITDRAVYLDPLKTLFREACKQYHLGDYAKGGGVRNPTARTPVVHDQARREVSRRELELALEGIKTLRDTYFKQYKAGEHRTAAQQLFDEIAMIVKGEMGGPRRDGEFPAWLKDLKVPSAAEWWDKVPQGYRTKQEVERLHFLLRTHEENSRLFQRPEDKKFKKIFIRHDLYIATKGWLERSYQDVKPEVNRRDDNEQHRTMARLVTDLHHVAVTLLCKSLRANPENPADFKAKLRAFFGKDVDWDHVQDLAQLEEGTLLYLNRAQREKCKLTFKNGLAYRYPFNQADLQLNEEFGPGQLQLADTKDLGELVLEANPDLGLDFDQRTPAAPFVVGHDRQFYITQHLQAECAKGMKPVNDVKRRGFKHSSYFAGERVLFAGGIRIKRGRVSYIECGSGHYKPEPLQLLHCLEALLAHGVALNEIWVQDFPLGKLMPNDAQQSVYAAKAMKYLAKRGNVDPRPVEAGGDCKYIRIARKKALQWQGIDVA